MFLRILLLISLMSFNFLCATPLTQAASALTGIWKNTFSTPTVTIEVFWRIKTDTTGTLQAMYACPVYGIKDVPVAEITLENGRLFMSVGMFKSIYEGRLTKNPDKITGFFTGGGPANPIDLIRVSPNPAAILDYMVPWISPEGKKETHYSYTRPVKIQDDWETQDITAAGLDSLLVQQLLEQILAEKYPNLHSILIVKDNKLVLEEYFYGYTAKTPHPIYSNGKGVTSTLIGMAIDQQIIPDIHQKISTYFPQHRQLLAEPGKRDWTLEHFLTMTSGLEWDEHSTSYYDAQNSNKKMSNSPEKIPFLFSQKIVHEPGTHYTYNSGLPQVLREILRKETGQFPWHFGEQFLFKPLEFKNYLWETDADGKAGGLLLRPRDFIKIAQFYLNRGEWQGKQLISANWFDKCYHPGRECEGPIYWNHWGKGVLMINGTPIEFYSGGGFGGQAIFGFPDLDLVVAMTAGNYFTPSVEQHEILKNYILPPLLNTRKQKKIPTSATLLNGLHWKKTFFTNLGAILGCLDYLNIPISEGWLYGSTGYAFVINANERINPNCLGRWNSGQALKLGENNGYQIRNYSAYISQPEFEKVRATAWDSVRAAINRGHPAYGFHMNIPESYVISGYDAFGYYFNGVDCSENYGPKCWQQVAQHDPNWFEMHTLHPCKPAEAQQTIRDALQYAVKLNREPEQFQHGGFTLGPKAYEIWQNALESGEADWFGVAYTAAGWTTCRKNAVAFLEEAQQKSSPELAAHFQKAIAAYRISAERWDQVGNIFPYENTERWQRQENWSNPKNRKRVAKLLQQAKLADLQGIEILATIADRL